VQRRVVKETGREFLSVLAEAFAVIAGDYDDGIVVDAGFFSEMQSSGRPRNRHRRFRRRRDGLLDFSENRRTAVRRDRADRTGAPTRSEVRWRCFSEPQLSAVRDDFQCRRAFDAAPPAAV